MIIAIMASCTHARAHARSRLNSLAYHRVTKMTSRRFVTIARASAAIDDRHPRGSLSLSPLPRGRELTGGRRGDRVRGGGGGRRKEKKSGLDRSSGHFLGGALTTLNFRIRASKRKREEERKKRGRGRRKREREREGAERKEKEEKKGGREHQGRERRAPCEIKAIKGRGLEYRYHRANLKTSRLSGSASRLLRSGLFRREKRDKRQTAERDCRAASCLISMINESHYCRVGSQGGEDGDPMRR